MMPWLFAARPKTLVAGFVPVLVGTAAAYRAGHASAMVFVAALLGALFIQVGTNYVNDASDFVRGADNEKRIGPPRMAQLGLVTPRQLYLGAGACFAFAIVCGTYLIFKSGWPMALIGGTSIIAAIAYTAGPFPLAYLGLGDFFVLVFFGLVAVCGTYFAHGNSPASEVYIFGVAVGAHAMALIAVNNIRDLTTDTIAGKVTLAVRLGERKSKIYILGLLFLPYLLVAVRGIYLVDFSLPLGVWAGIRVLKADGPLKYMAVLPLIAALQLTFGLLLAGALFAVAGN